VTAAFASAAALAAATVCLMPSVVDGNDATYGLVAAIPGLAVGAALSVVAGPLLASVLTYTEYEGGMRRVRYVAGQPLARLLASQCAAVAISCITLTTATAVLASICGLADQVARALSSNSTASAPVAVGHDLKIAAILAACAIVISAGVLLLGIVVRSGSRTATGVVAAAGSWLALVLATHGIENRWWLMLHPLAGPWMVSHLDLGDALAIRANPVLGLASSTAWVLLVVWFARRSLDRP
jgi:hypothetical protein